MPVAVEQAGNFGAPSKQTKQNNEQRFSESAVPPTRMRARCCMLRASLPALASLDSAFVHRQESSFWQALHTTTRRDQVVTGGNHIDHGQCGHLSGST